AFPCRARSASCPALAPCQGWPCVRRVSLPAASLHPLRIAALRTQPGTLYTRSAAQGFRPCLLRTARGPSGARTGRHTAGSRLGSLEPSPFAARAFRPEGLRALGIVGSARCTTRLSRWRL